jgi:hypothetical protein
LRVGAAPRLCNYSQDVVSIITDKGFRVFEGNLLKAVPYLRFPQPLDGHLRDRKFYNANLIVTDLKRVYLSGANLTGANISESNLRKANLAGANFKDVKLSETKLTGVDLSKVVNLSPKEVSLAIIDKKTKVPDSLEIFWTSDDTFECKSRPLS